MGSEEGDGMANVDVAASWQQYYTWCGPYSHPHSHSHPPPQPHAHSHPHFPHPNHLNQYQQQSLAASTANASAHYSTSQQYHLQLQPSQTPPLHQQQQQQQQFHPVRGQATLRRGSPYERPGKQGKDGPEEKKDADGELWGNVEAQAAFLGPNLWDKTLPYDADLKYVDLDEFLSENGIPVDGVAGGGQGTMQSGQLHKLNNTETPGHQGPAGLHLEPVTKRERSPSPSECCSPDTMNPPSPADSTLSMASSGRDFDPRTRAFSDEELKPQPMIKKSRKQFVPDDLKDDKYWARRRKNNMAAKRSRDARRMKENQIALRAGFLEKENMGLRQELDRLKNENMLLRDKLSKYTDV
ncbi:thyrotroph embryonic factor isoform X2 [Osmia bicornis bicornis]|uniref:thyrotroph embryonic factor isoform X2 n=1 Tax=Osmia bicornis bicornis TaxID=1437191 RepID=UPI001EAF35F3|nr:thyrotroph embryonic factor isoform X2 [Osmia bicornis bicornis]